MRRRTRVIGVTFAALTSAAMIVGDVPSAVLLDGPTLAAESESIHNSGVAVDGNVPPGVAESLPVPSAGELRNDIGGPPAANAGADRQANSNSKSGGDTEADDAAEAARRSAASRREAEQREAEAREEAAEREAEARADAAAREREARGDAGDARDFDRDDFEPDRP